MDCLLLCLSVLVVLSIVFFFFSFWSVTRCEGDELHGIAVMPAVARAPSCELRWQRSALLSLRRHRASGGSPRRLTGQQLTAAVFPGGRHGVNALARVHTHFHAVCGAGPSPSSLRWKRARPSAPRLLAAQVVRLTSFCASWASLRTQLRESDAFLSSCQGSYHIRTTSFGDCICWSCQPERRNTRKACASWPSTVALWTCIYVVSASLLSARLYIGSLHGGFRFPLALTQVPR